MFTHANGHRIRRGTYSTIGIDNAKKKPFQMYLGTSKRANRRKLSTPQWIRTTNLRFRRPMLYPIELGVLIGPDFQTLIAKRVPDRSIGV